MKVCMFQTRLDSFILSDVCQHIELSRLQKMTNEEATRVVEDKKIKLITSPSNTTGYWHVGKQPGKKFRVRKIPQYGIIKDIGGFRSKVATAVYISQKVGDPMVCLAIAQNFPETTDAQILTNLRIPAGLTNGEQIGSLWRIKTAKLFNENIESTKKRNSRGRKHDEVEWNLDELRKWIANELEKLGFRCYLGGLKLTPENVSIERLDESKGYSSANCVLIDIHFQVGYNQWSCEKVQIVHHLRKKEIEMDFGPKFFKMLEDALNRSRSSTKLRNTRGNNYTQSEITVEKLIRQYIKQGGRCYYLNIPLRMKGDWQISVERLDESKGYIEGNWVLTVLETQNGHAQWTKEFVESRWGPFYHPKTQLSTSVEDLIDKYNSYKIEQNHCTWTEEEDAEIRKVIKEYHERDVPVGHWEKTLPNRGVFACRQRKRMLLKEMGIARKYQWSEEEIKVMYEVIDEYNVKYISIKVWKEILPRLRLNGRSVHACRTKYKTLKKLYETKCFLV
jgi:hypothetical protein